MMNGKDPKEIPRMLTVGGEKYRRVNQEQRERFHKAMARGGGIASAAPSS